MSIWIATRNDSDPIDCFNTAGKPICAGVTAQDAILGVLDIDFVVMNRVVSYKVEELIPDDLYSVFIGIKGILDPMVVYQNYYTISKVVVYNEDD